MPKVDIDKLIESFYMSCRFNHVDRAILNELLKEQALAYRDGEIRYRIDTATKECFKKDDIITNGERTCLICDRDIIDGTFKVIDLPNGDSFNIYGNFSEDNLRKHGFHKWSINDARDGDILVDDTRVFFFMFNRYEDGHMYAHCTYNKEHEIFYEGRLDEQNMPSHIANIHSSCVLPASSYEIDKFFNKMYDSGYKWNDEEHRIEKIKTIDYEENVQLTDFEIFLQNLFDAYANYKGRLKNSYIKMLRKRLTDYLNEEEHIKEK